jgi:hypothetical protein
MLVRLACEMRVSPAPLALDDPQTNQDISHAQA